jgi:hypothetical protein
MLMGSGSSMGWGGRAVAAAVMMAIASNSVSNRLSDCFVFKLI